jgi:hypothetical protein
MVWFGSRVRLIGFLSLAAALGACSETPVQGPVQNVNPATGDGDEDEGDGDGDSDGDDSDPDDDDEQDVDASQADDSDAGADASTEKPEVNYGLPPFVADGEPLEADDKKWTWIDFPDSFCRDGKTAGISVSLNAASNNLMIYLEGGGACFDSLTCGVNPSAPQKNEKTGGLFDRSNAKNPVKDWNIIHVPYCTGDVHMGTNASATVEGLGTKQKFVGYRNMEAYLKRIVPTFPKLERVLLTGVSAGGFGAAGNAVLVQRAFAGIRVNLIDDSGPPMSSKVMPECLQQKWRDVWGLKDSMLKDCGAACANEDNFVFDFGQLLASKFNDRAAGLIESVADGTIRGFFGAGLRDCTGVPIIVDSVPEADFKAGLLEYREAVKEQPKFSTWYPAGTQHTWLGGASLYSAKIGDKALIDWVTDIVQDKSGSAHVGGD